MKASLFAATALLSFQAAAFPPWLLERDMDEEEMRKVARIAAKIEIDAEKNKRAGLPGAPGFNAEQQYVSTSGDHEYRAPGPDDLRGPCPGLNAMANHGYLPRNGVGTITDFIQGTYDAFGMGLDLATFLAIYGAVYDGDLEKWSIGGPPPSSLLSDIGLLGKPQGISNSHNKYESDYSPTRGDLYEYGNAYKLQMSQFEELYNSDLGDNGYDLSTLSDFRAKRFQESIDNNPYFFNAPFSGVVVLPAAYTFIYRFMANKSEEHPEGYLNGDVLKSFFAITGEPGNFEYHEGQERIPENWYKRAIGDEYTIPYLTVDAEKTNLEHPQFLSIGGNTGKTNTFTPLNIENLTKGVYDSKRLLKGDNAFCFGFQFTRQVSPDILKGVFSKLTKPLSKLNGALDKVLSTLSCPELQDVDTSDFDKYPGSKGSS